MIPMKHRVAIVGAGVSGLTCGVVFAERGDRTTIFAREIGQQTTSAVAGALWFPYDVEPANKAIPWAVETYQTLIDLARNAETGVSMIELLQLSRIEEIQIPEWAVPLGAERLSAGATALCRGAGGSRGKRLDTARRLQDFFQSGFSLRVPLMDTTVYLDYLANRFLKTDGQIIENVRLQNLEDVDPEFDLVINCAGFGARDLVGDTDLEPHRGQVAIVRRINDLPYAVVCDDAPLMYAIPRRNDCLFGGTNELSDDLAVDSATTARIVAECSRTLKIEKPNVLAERVGLRPYRKSGVRVERAQLSDGRVVVHNYGHGGAGFTLSWGCAAEVLQRGTAPS
jgi:D-amino-acid oxidase